VAKERGRTRGKEKARSQNFPHTRGWVGGVRDIVGGPEVSW